MISIFYDLETSDLNKVGQILNFAFVCVDDEFEIIETFHEKVRISKLQLPNPRAILANRIDVIEHQQEATLSESIAAEKIHDFLANVSSKTKTGKIPLIGFNSASFDLDFLRTVLIRNGFNPYYKNIVSKDLLLLARQLFAFNADFRNFFKEDSTTQNRINFKLESLCQRFKLLNGKQSHESLSDVILTINLAKKFAALFETDIRDFEPYQVRNLHEKSSQQAVKLIEPIKSHYNLDREPFISYPAVILDYNDRYALWVDLAKYMDLKKTGKDPRTSIKWKKIASDLLFSENLTDCQDFQKTICEIKTEFAQINLENYFTETDCDIEQHIYRIKPYEITELAGLINTYNFSATANADIKHLVKRHWLENFNGDPTPEYWESLRKYANYRYNGKLKLVNSDKDTDSDSKKAALTHSTFNDLVEQIKNLKTDSALEENDLNLLDSLNEFYNNSDIGRLLRSSDFQ